MRVCVIGCGASGLPAIKECRVAGIDVVAYERTSDIGGLWNYRPQIKDGGSINKSTICNTSKEMMAYSDFPPPIDYPNFMHNSLIRQYLYDYAKNFDLLKEIRFNTNVEKLERVNEKWEVTTNEGTFDRFDFVMLCTGHHTLPRYPQIKGIENFKGQVLHSKEYHNPHEFKNKNVVIVGLGNSAINIAVELAHIAHSVTISTRRGAWIASHLWTGGMPYDVALYNRFYNCLFNILPWTILNDYMERHYQSRLGHYKYGLRPHHRFFEQPFVISDALPNLLSTGQIVITGDIDYADISGVVVEGGHRFEVDVIIYATGYTVKFPYLNPESIIPIKENETDLYKSVFTLDYPSLAVIGLVEPIGTVAPIAELQSRWAAAVFSGRLKLPSKQEMRNDIDHARALRIQRYYKSPRTALQVDYMRYMDEIATLIGCKPNIWKYTLSDPWFAVRLFVGANASYVYRLEGEGSWSGAKDALISLHKRVKKPLKNRDCRMRRYKRSGNIDHYFWYLSMKGLARWIIVIFMTLIWATFSAPSKMFISYSIYVFIFLNLFVFSMFWFDREFNFITLF